MEAKIYKLIDPLTSEVRYVGWTKNPLNRRLSNHVSEARCGANNHRAKWIRKLLRHDLTPIIEEIETVDYYSRNKAERFWISYYGRASLVNGTDGGEGASGLVFSEEQKRRISNAHVGQIPWNAGISSDTSHLSSFKFSKGHKPWNKGIERTSKTKEKISTRKSGIPTGKKINSSNPFLGVTYNGQKYISQISFCRKKYYIGRYETAKEGAVAYDVCSLWLSKENRVLNFRDNEWKYTNLIEKTNPKTLKELRLEIKNHMEELYD